MLIGYARTSTVEQVAGLEAQQAALDATGCQKLFAEAASSVAPRDQFAAIRPILGLSRRADDHDLREWRQRAHRDRL